MADISKCGNETCKLRNTCYRYTAEANPFRQAYADFEPTVKDGKTTCDYYWKDERTDSI